MKLSTQYKVRIAYAPLLVLPMVWYWHVLFLEAQAKKNQESKPKKPALVEIMPSLTPTIRVSEAGEYFWNQARVSDSILKINISNYLTRAPKQTIVIKAMPKATVEKVWYITAYINQSGGKVTVSALPDTARTK
jgi:biopolymer transport protein ExbD